MQPRTPYLAILREGKQVTAMREEVGVGTYDALVSRNIKLLERECVGSRTNSQLAKAIKPCRARPPKLIDNGKKCSVKCESTASRITKRDTIEQCAQARLARQAILVALPHCTIRRADKLRPTHCCNTLNTPFAALWLTHLKGRAHIAILLNILDAPGYYCAFAIGVGPQFCSI